MTDIEIAHQAKMRNITELLTEKLGIPSNQIEPYTHYKAKLSLDYIDSLQDRDDVVIREQAPRRCTPDVDPRAVRDEQVGVDSLEGAFDALDGQPEVAGQDDRRIASRVADLHQSGPTGKGEHPQQCLNDLDPQDGELIHVCSCSIFRATNSQKLPTALVEMDSTEKPARATRSGSFGTGRVVRPART